MKASRDRVKKDRAGKESRPKVTDSELAQRVAELCQLVRQQNTELLAQLQRQRRALLARLPAGRIQ